MTHATQPEPLSPPTAQRWTARLEVLFFALLASVWLASLLGGLGLADAYRGRLSWLALGAGALVLVLPGGRRRWLDAPRFVLVVLALWSFADVYARVGGDGTEYYVTLRSVVIDHDLDFTNDYAGLGAAPVLTREGQATSRFPIGLALLWAPHFLIAHALAHVARWFGGAGPADGLAPVYHLAVTRASFLYGLAGLLLIEALLRRLYGRGLALLATVAIWLATPLHFYMEVNPGMSHAASAFAAAGLLVTWWRARNAERAATWLWVGCWGGILALVRAQDAVLVVLPVIDLLVRERRRSLPSLARLLVGPGVAVLLQGLFWLALYGPGFAGTVMRQGRVARIAPHVLDLLFSARHGFFTWTPLYIVAVSGWLLLMRRERLWGALVSVGFVLAVVLNAAHGDWWGSDSFGQRRLLGLTPLLALGLGEALDYARRRPLVPLAGLIIALAWWNLQFEYVFNSQLVADRTQAVTLDRLASAEADAAFHDLMRFEQRLPRRAFVLLYDNLKGVWLDEGSHSLGGKVDLGQEPSYGLPRILGSQWYPPETSDADSYRRPRGRRASLRVPIRTVDDFDLTIRARQLLPELPVAMSVAVNGVDLGSAQLTLDWTEPRFALPRTALHSGFNEMTLAFSAAPRAALPGYEGRNAAAAVQWLAFARRGPSPDLAPSWH